MYPLTSEGVQLIKTLEAENMVANRPVGGEAAIDEDN